MKNVIVLTMWSVFISSLFLCIQTDTREEAVLFWEIRNLIESFSMGFVWFDILIILLLLSQIFIFLNLLFVKLKPSYLVIVSFFQLVIITLIIFIYGGWIDIPVLLNSSIPFLLSYFLLLILLVFTRQSHVKAAK